MIERKCELSPPFADLLRSLVNAMFAADGGIGEML
jgi:hypothetical protein